MCQLHRHILQQFMMDGANFRPDIQQVCILNSESGQPPELICVWFSRSVLQIALAISDFASVFTKWYRLISQQLHGILFRLPDFFHHLRIHK